MTKRGLRRSWYHLCLLGSAIFRTVLAQPAKADFKLGVFDLDFGVGYGLTSSSDRWVVKTIIGYTFPVSTRLLQP
jgi:hypothetical protein